MRETYFCLMDVPIQLAGETMHLLGERAMLWEARQTLIISDLHLGKANHFRKAGIPVPNDVSRQNLSTLTKLLYRTKPKRVILLGDLFHSDHNRDWDAFVRWRKQFDETELVLVMGNHDILPDYLYEEVDMTIYRETMEEGPFLFSHHPKELQSSDDLESSDDSVSGLYRLSGHIHPGIRLVGKGLQSLRLPCFYFGERQGLLPAFGAFTGFHRIKPQNGDRVYAIAEGKVVGV